MCICLDFFCSLEKQDVILYPIPGSFKPKGKNKSSAVAFKTLKPLNASPQYNSPSYSFKVNEPRLTFLKHSPDSCPFVLWYGFQIQWQFKRCCITTWLSVWSGSTGSNTRYTPGRLGKGDDNSKCLPGRRWGNKRSTEVLTQCPSWAGNQYRLATALFLTRGNILCKELISTYKEFRP